MFKNQIAGNSVAHPTVTSDPPTDDDGISMSLTSDGGTRASLYVVTIVIGDAPATITIWGCLAQGAPEDESDDLWGTLDGDGVLGTALPIGTYHFTVYSLGIFSRAYIQASDGTVTALITPILTAGRGN